MYRHSHTQRLLTHVAPWRGTEPVRHADGRPRSEVSLFDTLRLINDTCVRGMNSSQTPECRELSE